MSIDTIELIAAFNLFVLPPIVAALVITTFAYARARRRSSDPEVTRVEPNWELDRVTVLRWIGLINYGLALRAIVAMVPELQAYLVFGSSWLFPPIDLGLPLLVALVNVPIGLGLRRLRPWGRWTEVGWNAVFGSLSLMFTISMWRYGAVIALEDWPEFAVSRVLPFYLVLVMLLPGTGRVISARQRLLGEASARWPAWPRRSSLVSAVTLGFLIILGSVVVLSALDWIVRIRPEVAGPG